MHLLNVTDGLMVQVTMEAMADLRRSLRDMKDFTVTCGKLPPAERQEYVHIQWQDEELRFNKGLETNIYIFTFSHLADAFIQSDLQMMTMKAIKTNKRAICKCYDKSQLT